MSVMFFQTCCNGIPNCKKVILHAKKSFAWFLVTDETDNRIDKRKSLKVNGDMNLPVSNRKRRNKTKIQVKVEVVETDLYQMALKQIVSKHS